MKPRLIPSLHTREDRLIWLRLNLPLGKSTPKIMIGYQYHESDRRDAELMLSLAVMKQKATWERRCPGQVIHIAWAFAGLEGEIKEGFR
jgi:hypothetical protein